MSGDDPRRVAAAAGSRRAALRFVLLIGVVSMFSDMAHEGARGITGPFLATLGASAATVAIVAGFGELLGYALRFVFGYAADRTGRYWPITLFGYVVQMAVVPMLALAGSWQVAAVLIIAERTGRAIRNPARDAMLAHATGELGRGWVFGVREALDAFGAMLGPLLVAAAIWWRGGYRVGFAVLLVPAVLTLVVLLLTWRWYPVPARLEVTEGLPEGTGLPVAFWTYLAAMGLIAMGYADYPLIAYHFGAARVLSPHLIPVLYAAAMATEAVGALVLGRLFDRIGLLTVVAATVLTAMFAPLVFLGGPVLAVAGVVLWGVGMAAQESVVKAAITGMVPATRRASAYGLFDTGFGVLWFLGSVVLGLLYQWSLPALVAFSVVVQLAAIPLLLLTRRRLPRQARPAPAGG
ncbi:MULTISPECIES: MFS transporter [Micromonospora]|uniref:MFS transporter n=1 Tax=Micromonospora solifontis TaxID=2487138 RepID=A0ABX9WC03_9ACTN|nr:MULTISPECIES: MFS transporter [Micromonospora]NES16992.1 MFS transporter [Micromonospora sp. PPF5-17B]NES38405.1 MFS transporter [Micromonospora solifontis]NES58727.1 MFS transporter [Micromonospora sp. PPF5-6]RNL95820.1 MFS transporter [Micromonospora solifontis]